MADFPAVVGRCCSSTSTFIQYSYVSRSQPDSRLSVGEANVRQSAPALNFLEQATFVDDTFKFLAPVGIGTK